MPCVYGWYGAPRVCAIFHNGQPVVGQAIRLEDGDVIQVVGVKMGFFAKS